MQAPAELTCSVLQELPVSTIAPAGTVTSPAVEEFGCAALAPLRTWFCETTPTELVVPWATLFPATVWSCVTAPDADVLSCLAELPVTTLVWTIAACVAVVFCLQELPLMA